MSDAPAGSMFRVLIATDIHLGYAEKDPIRGDDTFNSFEEVLQIATEKNADFLLLGGDLFHENKPSARTMKRCTELLRRYCHGSQKPAFKIVNETENNLDHSDAFPHANHEDPNIQIKLPVFSIHGNHDDPLGKDPMCALETLSAAGLINYFGKHTDMSNIEVKPILITKNQSRMALFGLGSLPEDRLQNAFQRDRVHFTMPVGDPDTWFKLFVVHQNRVAHGKEGKGYLNPKDLTDLPDLVIWGHEHESIQEVAYNQSEKFFIYQPGSTVITSLCEAESKPKQVGLLEVFSQNGDNKFRVKHLAMKSPRRLYIEDMNIPAKAEDGSEFSDTRVVEQCKLRVEELLTQASLDHSGDPMQPKLPLIRLRVFLEDEYQTFSSHIFGQKYSGRVANPKEMILFKKKRDAKEARTQADVDLDRIEEMMDVDNAIRRCNIEDVVGEYFEAAEPKNKLDLLDEIALTTGVKSVVEKEASTDTIASVIELQMQETLKKLEMIPELDVDDEEAVLVAFRQVKDNRTGDEKKQFLDRVKEVRKYDIRLDAGDDFDGSEDEDQKPLKNGRNGGIKEEPTAERPARGAATGRARRSRGRPPRGGGTKRRNRMSSDEEDFEPASTRRASRSKKTAYDSFF